MTPRRDAGQRGIAREPVLDVAVLKRLLVPAEDVAEVVSVRAIREHVRHLKLATDLGVRIPGHHHGHLAATQVIRLRFAAKHAFDLPRPVAQRDELLQELGIRVLDVIEIDHDIVSHLESEVQLLDFLPR